VVTSGPILKHPKPTVPAGWLKKGGFASLVDFDSYFSGPAIQEAQKLSTDDIPQMDYYRTVGYFKETPRPYADLGEVVAGKKKGRENDEERCIAINLGIALDDMAVAPLIYKKAKEKGIGTELPL
jgi:ornithine cyclodeaminase/alanine dehydrogenase-like protein (mu-crystallin family)